MWGPACKEEGRYSYDVALYVFKLSHTVLKLWMTVMAFDTEGGYSLKGGSITSVLVHHSETIIIVRFAPDSQHRLLQDCHKALMLMTNATRNQKAN